MILIWLLAELDTLTMQFTPQQLSGGPRFSSVTRIGNWQEEVALEEAKISNFRNGAKGGSLSLRKLEHKMSLCNAIVPHSHSPDGVIHFGDSIILQHDSSGSLLACDPFEEIVSGNEKYLVSSVADDVQPKARYVFRITRPSQHLCNFIDDMNDPIVRIGQPFLLAVDESLLVQPGSNLLAPALYLCSTKKNERMATKRTNRQLVYTSPSIDSDAIWFTSIPSQGRKNGRQRFLANGEPLTSFVGIQLTHRQTNQYLTCDPSQKTPTEFGIEFETFADRSAACGKLGIMVSEFNGKSTSQTLSKPDASTFSWHIVLSESPSKFDRTLPLPATEDTILNEIRASICAKGVDAFWNLRDYIKNIENKMNARGKMDREDLKAALFDWGLEIKPRYLDVILDAIDTGKMNLIVTSDFFAMVRGPLSESRETILMDAFLRLDKTQQGEVAVDDIKEYFRGDEHPLVSLGGASESQALEHMIQSYAINGRIPKYINFDTFSEYYGDLSVTIDDDGYFEAIIKSNFAPLF